MSVRAELTSSPRHPLAGQTMTGADMVIQVLADEGVDIVFGYSGGAILPTWDALGRYNIEQESKRRKPIELVVPANEQGAGFMAAGYARASGKIGVSIVTSGPGATNSVTPVRDCMADSIPIVLICGQVPRAAIGTDAFQEAPVFNIMSACAKRAFLVLDPEELEATVRTAFEIARSDRPGPVVLDIPKDVQNWKGTFRGEGVLDLRGYRERMEALYGGRMPESKGAAFFDILRNSERPLIYAGGGVIKSDASRELRRFATSLKIPVVTTLQGIGSFDTTHPLALHMLGMHGTAYANYAVEDCDFLIAIGARFDDRVAGNAAKFARPDRLVINVDGDGSLRMNIGEMETVTNYNLPVKTLLFNNQGDGMVRQWQKMFFAERFCGTEKFLHRKDFVNAARADGFEFAVRVSEKKRVERVLQEFVHHNGPAFLEVMIDPDACVFPMVAPGLSYKEMVTGPHITPRTQETKPPAKPTDLF